MTFGFGGNGQWARARNAEGAREVVNEQRRDRERSAAFNARITGAVTRMWRGLFRRRR